VVTFFGASTITRVLGDSYDEAAVVLQWAAFMPLLWAWQLFAGNALSGIGHHRTRLLQTMSSAVLNLALNVALIPNFSWRGAAFATIVTEIYLVVLHWRTLLRLASREEDVPAPVVAAAT
jgi:O-antigen/teichoic acid export membrane protein